MINLSKIIISNHDIETTRSMIKSNFDLAIKNEFFFSEAFVEESEKESFYICIKTIPLLRRSFPTRYKVLIEEVAEGSEVHIKSGTVLLRLFILLTVLAGYFFISPEPIFLNSNIIEMTIITPLALSWVIGDRVRESKVVLEAIKKSIKT